VPLFDENDEILRRMASDGSNLGPPRLVDFSHAFPDETSANSFARAAEQNGFQATTETVESDEDPWDVTASKVMQPSCENITATEEHLDALARKLGGRSDGWGFLNP